jgi:3-oxoacyl-[acyl-carrier protein] reductase
MKLRGKIAVVTGAAQGIGRVTALRLAKEGADIVVADINEEGMKEVANDIEKMGRRSLAVKTDISQEKDVFAMVQKTLEVFGRIDILVNNAGGRINTPNSIEETTAEEWNQVMAVNLTGTFFCCKAVLPNMKKNRSGKIVNVSSKAGRTAGLSTTLAYASAKSGVLGLTRQLAYEMGPFGINVNAIAPGFTSSGPKWEKEVWSLAPKEKKDLIINANPLRRIAQPEEQANVILFLCTDDASFINGACIDSNGGAFMA